MINNLSVSVHAFTMLALLSVDEILLPRYGNYSSIFRGLPLKVEMFPSCLNCMNSFTCIHNISCCLLLVIQLGFGLGRCIFQKRWNIWVIYIYTHTHNINNIYTHIIFTLHTSTIFTIYIYIYMYAHNFYLYIWVHTHNVYI